jgi:hypothetical protein
MLQPLTQFNRQVVVELEDIIHLQVMLHQQKMVVQVQELIMVVVLQEWEIVLQ